MEHLAAETVYSALLLSFQEGYGSFHQLSFILHTAWAMQFIVLQKGTEILSSCVLYW